MDLPVLRVSFDDGTEYEIEARARDLLAVERDGVDVTASTPIQLMYATALAALTRLQRIGEIPAEIDLPKSVDDLADVADVEAAAGKDS